MWDVQKHVPPRWSATNGRRRRLHGAEFNLHFLQQRRSWRVGNDPEHAPQKVHRALGLVLLRERVRFVKDRAQNVVTLRVSRAREIETSRCANVMLRRPFEQPEVLQHRGIARPRGEWL